MLLDIFRNPQNVQHQERTLRQTMSLGRSRINVGPSIGRDVPSGGDVDSWGAVRGGDGVWEASAASSQVCREPQTALNQ